MKNKHYMLTLRLNQQEEYAFGEDFLGLRFVYEAKGDKYAFKTPKAYNEELLGFLTFSAFPVSVRHYSQSLYLDLVQSETKAVNFIFNLGISSLKPSSLVSLTATYY